MHHQGGDTHSPHSAQQLMLYTTRHVPLPSMDVI